MKTLQFWCTLALISFGISNPFAAHAVEDYREITLVDGRVFVGEVTATEAGGLRTKLPQGTLLVPCLTQDMVPADSASSCASKIG